MMRVRLSVTVVVPAMFTFVAQALAQSTVPGATIEAEPDKATSWSGTAPCVLVLTKEDYAEDFREELSLGFADMIYGSFHGEVVSMERSGKGHWLVDSLPRPTRSSLRSFAEDVAARLVALEGECQCGRNLSAEFVARAQVSDGGAVKLSAPKLVALGEPEINDVSIVDVPVPLRSPLISLVQVPESTVSGDDLRDPTSDELIGAGSAEDGQVWKIRTVSELRLSFTGKVRKTVSSFGEAKFGGVGSKGNVTAGRLDNVQSIAVFDKWKVAWEYDGDVVLKTTLGTESLRFKGIYTDVEGRSPDPLAVAIHSNPK